MFDDLDGRVGDGGDAFGSRAQDAGEIGGVGDDLVVALLEGLEMGDDHVGDLLFQLAVAQAGELGFDFVVGCAGESLVDGGEVENAGAGGFEIDGRVGISSGPHNDLADLVGGIEQGDRVIGAGSRLAHFLGWVVQAHDPRPNGGKAGAGDDEGVAVQGVEALGDVAGELEVLGLVFADRDNAGLVEQDVGGHEDRILKQAIADGFLFGGLNLVLGHALQPADRGDTGEHPGELGVGWDGGLYHDGAGLRVDTSGQIDGGDLPNLGAKLGGFLENGEGVQVDDAEDALVLVLDADPIFERAEVIPDVEIAGRLHAGEDSCFHGKWNGGNFYPKQF